MNSSHWPPEQPPALPRPSPRTPQPDVLFQGTVKEEVVLRDETDGLGELLQRELADVLSAQGDGASRHIPKPGVSRAMGGLPPPDGPTRAVNFPVDGQSSDG